MREADLPDRRGGLALLEPQRPLGESELTPPQGNGARGHQNDLLPPLAQP